MRGLIPAVLLSVSAGLPLQSKVPGADEVYSLPTSEIRIRDPFILAHNGTRKYYMYASLGNRFESPSETFTGNADIPHGVEVYESRDLKYWRPARRVLSLTGTPEDKGVLVAVWAPEVHLYKGAYYMFVTIIHRRSGPGTVAGFSRAVHTFHADKPSGPFLSLNPKSVTPPDWLAIDGTLWIEDGLPHMVFVHEWTQIGVGTMELAQLRPDLSGIAGRPATLFRATDAPWAGQYKVVTDGPWLHRLPDGTLVMLWSNDNAQGLYCVGIARSTSGKLKGPWKQDAKPLVINGGHGMIFTKFSGEVVFLVHSPNTPGQERAKFIPLSLAEGDLRTQTE